MGADQWPETRPHASLSCIYPPFGHVTFVTIIVCVTMHWLASCVHPVLTRLVTLLIGVQSQWLVTFDFREVVSCYFSNKLCFPVCCIIGYFLIICLHPIQAQVLAEKWTITQCKQIYGKWFLNITIRWEDQACSLSRKWRFKIKKIATVYVFF